MATTSSVIDLIPASKIFVDNRVTSLGSWVSVILWRGGLGTDEYHIGDSGLLRRNPVRYDSSVLPKLAYLVIIVLRCRAVPDYHILQVTVSKASGRPWKVRLYIFRPAQDADSWPGIT